MKAMILAAGFGSRLFPLTIDRTKPAIPFLGKPLIQRVVEHVAKFGFKDAVVNLHHRPDSVKAALGNGKEFGVSIHYTYEKTKILGTSGALDNAKHLLGKETFLLANGKIITDINIDAALETHRRNGALATMVLKENSNYEKFTEVVVKNGQIIGFGKEFPTPNSKVTSRGFPLMFTGIHILEPRVFSYIPQGVYSDIVPTFYNPAIKNGEKIVAHITKQKWFELSTIRRYLDISLRMLNGSMEKRFIGSNSKLAESSKIEESVIWDDVKVGAKARVYRSIIGDAVTIKAGEVHRNVAIVRAKMLESCSKIPEKAIKGKIIGDNYVVPFL